jgi:uncharacterized membrane protein
VDTGIPKALERIQTQMNVDIRVHMARNPFLKDPTARALEIFNSEKLTSTNQRNTVLIFLNLRRKNFAILADKGVHQKVGQKYWDQIAAQFKEDLQSTYYENAVVVLLYTLAEKLRKIYPVSRQN